MCLSCETDVHHSILNEQLILFLASRLLCFSGSLLLTLNVVVYASGFILNASHQCLPFPLRHSLTKPSTATFPCSRPFTNGSVIDTKARCRNLMPFHAGKIMLCDLNLNAENLLAHKKLHLTQVGVKLLGVQFTFKPWFNSCIFFDVLCIRRSLSP